MMIQAATNAENLFPLRILSNVNFSDFPKVTNETEMNMQTIITRKWEKALFLDKKT